MITTKKDFKEYVLADRLANSKPVKITIDWRIKQLLFPDRVWKFILLLRKTEYAYCRKNDFFGFFCYVYYLRKFKRESLKLGFTIPLNVFGPGLSIPHYGTIVVNGSTRVGKNCRLHAGVNIGASNGSDKSPVIKDNVYIAPGVIIFGEIIIADNVTIGANSTVNKSILESNVTVVGSPAEIISKNTVIWWKKHNLNLIP